MIMLARMSISETVPPSLCPPSIPLIALLTDMHVDNTFHAAVFRDRDSTVKVLGSRQGHSITALLQNALHYTKKHQTELLAILL